MKLTQRSLKRLEGVHPDLKKVAVRASEITKQAFQITEGMRTKNRQRQLVRKGASKTMRSRHLTGHALDVVAMIGGRVSWEVPLYYVIAEAFKQAAKELGIPIQWGGDWKSFFDGPHMQLPRAQYPANEPARPARKPQGGGNGVLRPGDHGPAVQRMQGHLGISADGYFGPKTRAALVEYQAEHGLTPDGFYGPATRKAMGL